MVHEDSAEPEHQRKVEWKQIQVGVDQSRICEGPCLANLQKNQWRINSNLSAQTAKRIQDENIAFMLFATVSS